MWERQVAHVGENRYAFKFRWGKMGKTTFKTYIEDNIKKDFKGTALIGLIWLRKWTYGRLF
jgi:hypothetical protein